MAVLNPSSSAMEEPFVASTAALKLASSLAPMTKSSTTPWALPSSSTV